MGGVGGSHEWFFAVFFVVRFRIEDPQPLKRPRRGGFYGITPSIHVETPAGPILVPVRRAAWRMFYD